MDYSTPGFPVFRYLPEFVQTHVHWISGAILSSHLLSSPSPPALNLSQDQGLFQWVSFSHQVAKVLELQFQHQSFQWEFRLTQASLVAQRVKNPAVQETRVWSLVWEDPLEMGMTTHTCILGWRIPWKEEPGCYSSWSCRNGYYWATNAFTSKLFLVIFKFLAFILIIIWDKQRKCFLIAYYVAGCVLRIFP